MMLWNVFPSDLCVYIMCMPIHICVHIHLHTQTYPYVCNTETHTDTYMYSAHTGIHALHINRHIDSLSYIYTHTST